MRASKGDRVIVRSTHIGEPVRDGEILEARGQAGEPPWLVRWSDDGHSGLFFPAGNCEVHHHAKQKQH